MATERWTNFLTSTESSFTAVDFAGKSRKFTISGSENGEGASYTIYAKEGSDPNSGFEFSSHSYASPSEALTAVVQKARRGITTRHLDTEGTGLLASRAVGRVAMGGVVIDGRFIDWEAFATLMQSYEGWEFELTVSSD